MTQNCKTSFKKTGISWIWEIPEDWKIQRLKSVILRSKNWAWWTDPKWDENDIVCIRVADFDKENYGICDSNLTYRNITDCEDILLEEWDLLLEKSWGGDSQLVWRVVNFNQKFKAITSNFLATIKVNKNLVDNKFLYYLLKYYYSLNINYRSIKQTTGIQNLDSDSYFQEPIVLPDNINTQTTIANFLDKKITVIKKFIDNKKKLIELLNEQKQSIIHQSVTKGIDSNAKMKECGISWIGEIPEVWNIVPFSKYFTSVIDYRWKTPEKVDFSDYILVTTRNIKDGIIDYDLWLEYVSKEGYNDSRWRGLPKNWDIIFTMEAPLWECAIVDNEDVTFGQRIVKFRLNDRLIPEYAIYSMKSFFFQSILQVEATGSTVLGLKSSKIHKLKFILPDIETQRSITKYIKKETSQIDSAIEKIEKEITLIEEYQTSLIYQVVTGKITIS